ncbi:hypothetical protein [Brevibacterium sp. CS2]|uniref:hypothetical protein n=1 Tax=Brevibacterium sp. CS2 TaxID=2575923 RepID=UPI001586E712|nr:hypothetical protein [Brevibacterium sp. CS2]
MRNSGPPPETTVLRETIGVFGWSRMGRNIREPLEDVVGWAVEAERISMNENGEYFVEK